MQFLLKVIGDIAYSNGIARIAKKLNFSRKSLYRSLSADGDPSFIIMMKAQELLVFQVSKKQKVPV